MAKTKKSRSDDIENRFKEKYIPEPMSGCWLWEGSIDEKGYGKVSYKNYPLRAHRVSYWIEFGDYDNNYNILHKCDVRCCVNPYHLYLGNQKDNMLDKIRSENDNPNPRKGENNPNSKLKRFEVEEIRNSELKTIELSKIYGVSRGTINFIKKKETWRE